MPTRLGGNHHGFSGNMPRNRHGICYRCKQTGHHGGDIGQPWRGGTRVRVENRLSGAREYLDDQPLIGQPCRDMGQQMLGQGAIAILPGQRGGKLGQRNGILPRIITIIGSRYPKALSPLGRAQAGCTGARLGGGGF
jgi:hypothetical protein